MQPVPQNYMAYDRTIVVFSPDGRLLQVEYARQAVKRGSTCLGVKVKDAVILAATKVSTPLAVNETYKKIYELDEHIGAVSSGLLADARDLVHAARVKAQINRISYGERATVLGIAKFVSNQIHLVTQYAGVRPYGVGFIIGGVDKTGARLFETDPSGTLLEWKAQAIGKGAEKAKKIFISSYKEGMNIKSGIDLALKALKAGEKGIKQEEMEFAIIDKERFIKFSGKEIDKHV